MTATHVRRWHLSRVSVGTGTIYQGRYKAVAVQEEAQFYTVCRYVERNPVRAGLVAHPPDWRWSSAWPQPTPGDPMLSDWPVARPPNWPELVDREQPPAELTELREAIARARPLGSEGWATRVMASTGWTVGMRPRGRPRKQKNGVGMNFIF